MFSLPMWPSGIRTLSTEESQRLDGLYPGIPDPRTNCLTCRGAKQFRWWDYYAASNSPEPMLRNFDEQFATVSAATVAHTVVDYACPCVDQWIGHRYFLHCGIGKHYQRLCWEDTDMVPPGAKEQIQEYSRHAEWNLDMGVNLVLRGSIASGKTLLATLLLKELLGRGYTGFFTSFTSMIDMFTASWRQPDEKAWFERQIKNAKVLVIDDIGRENRHRELDPETKQVVKTYSTGLAESTIDTVLRHRLSNAHATIITTNYQADELGVGYGANVFSLLNERSSVIECESPIDYRQEMSMERLDAQKNLGLRRPVVIG